MRAYIAGQLGALGRSGQKLQLMVSLEMLASTSPTQYYPIPAIRHGYGNGANSSP